ncbi:MAG: hypothetical protein Kow0089_13190 [Desulfobulbaceae bacterium]
MLTYVIGGVLVLLLIALVLVFRPPKTGRSNGEGAVADTEHLDLESRAGRAETREDTLDLQFDEPKTKEAQQEEKDGEQSELDLFLSEENDFAPREVEDEKEADLVAEAVDEEFDEDIPFIDEEQGHYERKEELSPALADVPEDEREIDEDETPEELLERLEYFLGTGDEDEEETGAAAVEAEAEAAEEEAAAGEEVAEPSGPALDITADRDSFATWLREREKQLRAQLEKAVEGRESSVMGAQGAALEDICAGLDDPDRSFQRWRALVDDLEPALVELGGILAGFRHETVLAALRSADFETARSLLSDATEQLDASPQAARVLYLWGRVEESRGDFPGALTMQARACDQDGGNLEARFAAGRLARITGDPETARDYLEKLVEEQGEGELLGRARHELAKTLIALDEDKERAAQLLDEALATLEKECGPDHPGLGPVLHDMALIHDSAGRYEQAESLYRRALEVMEKGLGPDSPRLAPTLARLGGLYEEIEKAGEAEPLYTRALAIRKWVLGENHPDVGSVMGSLANLWRRQGRYEEAEPMYVKSLEIAETSLGRDHPNLAVFLNDMAELYAAMGDEKRAEEFQERAFSLFGLPGMGDGFVEMEKDDVPGEGDDEDRAVT